MARFYTIDEVVDDLCLLSGDIFRRNKGLYLSVAKDVFNDMNEDVLKLSDRIKLPVRRFFNVDKRTNSIDIPRNTLKINSVSVVDRNGCFHPVYRNDNISDDIVDVDLAQNSGCNKCNNRLCNTIKGYEAVESEKTDYMPNGDPVIFKCVDRKAVDGQGFFYSETQYPLRVYESGVWTDTILYTEQKKLCEVEVDNNGCIIETDSNVNNICTSCGIDVMAYGGNSNEAPCNNPAANTWTYHCASVMDMFNVQCGGYPYGIRGTYNNVYNISELGDRIIFPATFGWETVMVRFFEDITLKNLKIPYLAKSCFMTGLQFYSTQYHDKKQKLSQVYEQKFTKQKWGLLLEMNKYTILESKEIFTPQVHFPSYITRRREGDDYHF